MNLNYNEKNGKHFANYIYDKILSHGMTGSLKGYFPENEIHEFFFREDYQKYKEILEEKGLFGEDQRSEILHSPTVALATVKIFHPSRVHRRSSYLKLKNDGGPSKGTEKKSQFSGPSI
jgi:hypothetical protein